MEVPSTTTRCSATIEGQSERDWRYARWVASNGLHRRKRWIRSPFPPQLHPRPPLGVLRLRPTAGSISGMGQPRRTLEFRCGCKEMKWNHGVLRRSGARGILHEARISPLEKSPWTLWLWRASNFDVHSKRTEERSAAWQRGVTMGQC